MIIAFLGKGGSGKTTVSTLFTKYMLAQGKTVLAIDADHNQDFSFNLGFPKDGAYLGQGMEDLMRYCGLPQQSKIKDVYAAGKRPEFSLNPSDAFTEKYALPVTDRLRIMAGGPHTDKVLYGQSCSHVLTAPLKVYLPFLQLSEGQVVVVDEKAGADGAGTGAALGFDVAVVVSEPTMYGVKAAGQIAELLQAHGAPYFFVGNKVMDAGDMEMLREQLPSPPIVCLEQSKLLRDARDAAGDIVTTQAMQTIIEHARSIASNDRAERAVRKFAENRDWEEQQRAV